MSAYLNRDECIIYYVSKRVNNISLEPQHQWYNGWFRWWLCLLKPGRSQTFPRMTCSKEEQSESKSMFSFLLLRLPCDSDVFLLSWADGSLALVWSSVLPRLLWCQLGFHSSRLHQTYQNFSFSITGEARKTLGFSPALFLSLAWLPTSPHWFFIHNCHYSLFVTSSCPLLNTPQPDKFHIFVNVCLRPWLDRVWFRTLIFINSLVCVVLTRLSTCTRVFLRFSVFIFKKICVHTSTISKTSPSARNCKKRC